MADLGKLDSIKGSEDGRWLEITTPDGTPFGIKIKLMGIDSKKFKENSLAIRNYVNSTKERGKKVDDKAMDEKSFNMLASATMTWEGMEENGEEVVFSLENAKYIYEAYPIIADQVLAFVIDRSNFL